MKAAKGAFEESDTATMGVAKADVVVTLNEGARATTTPRDAEGDSTAHVTSGLAAA